jgi:hypothetical protein
MSSNMADGGFAAGRNTRFPGFDVLDQSGSWDDVTAGVVLARLAASPPLRFFGPEEAAVAAALFDQLLDQPAEPRVPVLSMVDARLADGQTDGWRHEDMPEDGAAFRASLTGLDEDARARGFAGFSALPWAQQSELIGKVQKAPARWHGLRADHVWSLWTRYACTAFYSHPWVWSEIGFGGPAYPRGYSNLGMDRREHWEVRDVAPGASPA